jgi:hypothetical protein
MALPVRPPGRPVPAWLLAALLLGAASPDARAQVADPVPGADTPRTPLLIDDAEGTALPGGTRVKLGADTFVDPSTGATFPRTVTIATADGRTIELAAAGSGVRKKFVVKVYAAALWYDVAAPLSSRPLDNLALDDMARRLVMTFQRDVDGDAIVKAYREGFDKAWGGAKPGPDLATDLDEFLARFEGGVRKGESIELLYIPGEGLYTLVAGRAGPVVRTPQIARSLWSIWLGPEPVSGDLRRDLVRFLK